MERQKSYIQLFDTDMQPSALWLALALYAEELTD